MERITLEQAKQYISLDDDFTNKTVQDCPYFTLTPSPKGDGWETVTYYTARKVNMYAKIVMEIMILGFISYQIPHNPVFIKLVIPKIPLMSVLNKFQMQLV